MALVVIRYLLSLVFVFFIVNYLNALSFTRAVARVEYSSSSCPKNAPPSTVDPYIDLGLTGCQGGTASLITYSNCLAAYSLSCPDTMDTYQPSEYAFQSVNGVTSGQEGQAAKQAHESFLASSNNAPTCAANYQNGGWISYFNWEAAYESSSNTIRVDVSSYRDYICSKSGNATFAPLSVLSGNGVGSGSINYTQMQDAVKNALDSSTLLGAVNNSLQGWGTGTGGGSSTVNIDYGQMSNAVSAGLNNVVGTTPSSLGMSSYLKPQSYTNSEISSLGNISYSDRLNTFFTDMKQTQLFSNFGLGELGNMSSGASAMNVSFGSYGAVSFDLANYSSTYSYIKGFLLLLASYLSVRVIILKR